MLKRLLYRFISSVFLVFIALTSAMFFPVALTLWLLSYVFDRNLRLLHLFTCFWASLYIWVFPAWKVTVSGKSNIDPDQTYVIVSNHQSLLDILVAFNLFIHFKWVSKAELFKIPLIGWNMYLNRYIRLERGKKHSIKKMYEACEQHLIGGSSVYLFPEGTRSPTGKMRDFKEGAFILSRRLGLPVLPIVINGSKNAVPKNSLNFHGRTEMEVEILQPVLPADSTSVQELTQTVREMIRSRVREETQT